MTPSVATVAPRRGVSRKNNTANCPSHLSRSLLTVTPLFIFVRFGMDAKRLTCIDYQALIDAGWRRSGTWTYLPTNSTACCPNYTIRLDVTKFKPARSQKRVIRKLTALLRGKDPLAAAATANPNPAAGGGAGGGAGAGATTATTATAAADASADASAPTPPLKKQRRRNGEAKSKGKSKQKAKVVKSALPPLSARATKVMATAKERLMAAVQRLRTASSWDESAVIDPSLITVRSGCQTRVRQY